MPPSHSERMHAIPMALRNAIVIPFVVLGLGLAVWSWWSEILLYGWLKKAQLYLMHGSFYPFGTWVIAMVFTPLFSALPAMLILEIIILLKVFPVPDPPPGEAGRSGTKRDKSKGVRGSGDVPARSPRPPSLPGSSDRFSS